jgi:DNA-nicking Smr family endonuclease
MMARRRTLHPEEMALWQAVARSTNPLHSPGFVPQPDVIAPPKGLVIAPPPAPPTIPLFSLGEKARTSTMHRLAPTLREHLAAAPLQMDAKAFGRMTRGKLSPEARIDLHGLTLAEAHPALISFILKAQSAGSRLVLVITGKGKRGDDSGPIPQRMGALRHQVPQWLRMQPLAQAVLQVAEAHLKHGGSGAYYVYLRRG